MSNILHITNEKRKLEDRKDLFLATLIHDLKNPLQAHISTLNLLNEGSFGELNANQKEILNMIIESNVYMKNMLCNFLNTYKNNNGVIDLERKHFELDKLLKKCINEVLSLALDKNIKILYKVNSCDNVLFADKTQIRRVIENLLNNTINYADKNSKVHINVFKTNGKIIINFSNKSPAISEKLKETMFDKYVCDDSLTNHQGVGLGLYFCKKIIEAHKGEIYHTYKRNRNIFTVEIPVEQEDYLSVPKVVL